MSDAPPRRGGFRPRTNLVHGGHRRSQYAETSEALFLTQSFVYPDAETAEARFKGEFEDEGFIYTRYANPTVAMFEDRMAMLEGAEAAAATASGMGAVTTALMALVKAGDHVVAARALFGSCRYVVEDLLPRFGVPSSLVHGPDLAAWEAAIRPETKVFFLETPANPTLEVIDIAAVARLAEAHGVTLVVDNVFATPMLQRPLELGAHVVVYSATKHVDGQGRCLAGVILGAADYMTDRVAPLIKHTGPSLSPFNAWVMVKALETLPLRVAAQTETAAKLADMLADEAGVSRVLYPGRDDHPQAALARAQMTAGGTLIAFDLDDQARAFRFLNALRIVAISNNLGDAKSLITHPATTTHQRLDEAERLRLGIGPGLLRFSVGLEDAQDLAEDLQRALRHA